jgi:hypothetical protein
VLVSQVANGVNLVVAERTVLDQLQVVLDADHRSPVAGQEHDVEVTKDGVNCPTLESKVAQVCSGE